MEELIVTSDELKQLFRDKILKDTNEGWFYKDTKIDIIALHKQETKHIRDITEADKYKLKKHEQGYY